jgi:hypothetical protein
LTSCWPSLCRPATSRQSQANASQALEGLHMDAHDLAIQERVINGELTPDQAVAEYLKLAKRGA